MAESSYWYFLNNYDGDLDAEKAEKDALFDYRESLATFEKAEEAYEEARLVIFGTPVNDEATNEEAEPIIVEGLIAKVQRLENRAYLARKDAAEAYANLDTLKQAWDKAKTLLSLPRLMLRTNWKRITGLKSSIPPPLTLRRKLKPKPR